MTAKNSIYHVVRDAWRAVAPAGGIKRVFGADSKLTRRAFALKGRLEARLAHDELYDEVFYRKYEVQKIGGQQIVESLQRLYDFDSAIDVGCGSGEILVECRNHHVHARGLEHSRVALEICWKRGLEVADFDLEHDASIGWHADLVISTEVAEHLPASSADRYVALMTEMATRVIILTAATPGQGGTHHVNEQPNSYWIEKFAAHGWRHRDDHTQLLRAEWAKGGVESQRARNVMAFTPAG